MNEHVCSTAHEYIDLNNLRTTFFGAFGHLGYFLRIQRWESVSIEGLEQSSRMADREDNVYRAKLAEQAERYDGKVFRYYLFLPLPDITFRLEC